MLTFKAATTFISPANSYTVYIIKIEGKEKIPDYVQIRDDQFTLLAYFRTDRPEKALIKCGLENKIEKIKEIIEKIQFGRLQKLDI